MLEKNVHMGSTSPYQPLRGIGRSQLPRFFPYSYTASLFCIPQIARACRDRARNLLFRGWSRLCLHAASLSAAEGSLAAATAAARAAQGGAMEKRAEKASDDREASAAAKDGQPKEKLDEAAVATPAAIDRAEKAEGALRTHGGQLVRTVLVAPAKIRILPRDIRVGNVRSDEHSLTVVEWWCSFTSFRG